MTKMIQTRELIRSSEFKRSFKRYLRRRIDFEKDLENIINTLLNNKQIPAKYKDHKLANCKDFKDCRELHIKPDLLMVYRFSEASVELIQLGSHSELFE